jgi:steroid delta-isomerase-like uncharacterized protein
MRKTTDAAWVLAVLIAACGGQGDVTPPPQAPPAPPAAAAAAMPTPEPPPPAPEPPKPSMLDLQKQLSQGTMAAINAHDAKKASETFAPDATLTVYGMGEMKGREAIEADMKKLFEAFPDFKIGVARSFAKDDVLINEWVMNGTQKGEFMGIKPTNKAVGVRGVSVVWVGSDGLVKQEHRYFDGNTLMAQLGQIKMPARAVPAIPSGDPEWHVAKGTPDESKQADVAKGMYAAMDKKSESDFLTPLDEKLTWSDLSAPKDMTGKADAKKFFSMFTKAFSDMKTTVDPVVAADDYVAVETVSSAIHSGPLGPFKATKKPVVLHGVDIMMVKDGKIAQGTSYINGLELPAQEGLLPKPKGEKAKDEKPKAAGEKAGDKTEKAEKAEKKGEAKPKAEAAGEKEKK